MSLFKFGEGHDGDKGEMKTPRNQIIQTPETQEERNKLDHKKCDEGAKNKGNAFKDSLRVDTDKLPPIDRNKKSDGSASGDPNKGQRERTLGRTTDMER